MNLIQQQTQTVGVGEKLEATGPTGDIETLECSPGATNILDAQRATGVCWSCFFSRPRRMHCIFALPRAAQLRLCWAQHPVLQNHDAMGGWSKIFSGVQRIGLSVRSGG